MKKYFLLPLLLALVPNMVFGASARFTQLVREKQRKMEQLEKCMGTNKGLKIAGISTLGLTAAGVAANIYEAKTIKDNEKTIEKKDEKIESLNKSITDKQALKAQREAAAAEQAALLAECKTQLTAEGANTNKILTVEKDENGDCKILSCSGNFEVAEDGKSCVEKTSTVATESDDFQNLCEGESFNGTFNVNSIPKEQTSGTGQVVEINVPVLAACTLSGENNTEDKCKELVQKCANPRAYHYNSETGVCACLGDAEARCLNGEDVCWDE